MDSNLAKIKDICRLYDLTPQRSKGQNFLFNVSVIEKMVKAAQIKKEDLILEVGPGLGILTESLIVMSNRVTALELDKKLFDFLKIKFIAAKNLELINGDILETRLSKFKSQNFKIVANLPYNITSSFLRKFLSLEPKPESMVVMVQKEVGERICARPGQLSLLAISVQLYGHPEIIDVVNSENFWPQPKVDSVILKIDQIKTWSQLGQLADGVAEKDFWRVVKVGFSAKRKQVVNNLAAGLRIDRQLVKASLLELGLDEKIRAQNLAISDWFRLAKSLINHFN